MAQVPSSFWLEDLSASGSLGRSTARGFGVLAFSQGGKLALHVLSTMILARLLFPDDFGLIAMAATVVNLLFLFKDAGLSTATIQQKRLTQCQVSTLFWLNVIAGLCLGLATLASAPLMIWLYDEPSLLPMLAVLALGVFLSSLGVQHEALMRRRMAFRKVALSDITSLSLGIVVAICLALAGFGWWALVAQKVVQMASSAILNWILCDWKPSFSFRWNESRQQFNVGLNVSAFNFVNYFSRNGDNVLIGWFWGSSALGVYSKAYDMLLGPLSQVTQPLYGLMLPLLARLRDDSSRYHNAYIKIMGLANLVVLPVAGTMITVPDALVLTLFGPGWEQANTLMAWFGLTLAFQLASSSTGTVLISQQRSRDLAVQGVVNSFITVTGFVCALPFGIEMMAAVYALSGLCLRLPFVFWQTGRKGPITARDLWKSLVIPMWAFVWVLVVMYLLRELLVGYPASAQVGLMVLIGVAALISSLLSTGSGRLIIKDILVNTHYLMPRQR